MPLKVDGCFSEGIKQTRVVEMDALLLMHVTASWVTWSTDVCVGFQMANPRKKANSHCAFGIESELEG